MIRLGIAASVFFGLWCAIAPAAAQFTDITAGSGIPVAGTREGGACFSDVDRDGDIDAYVPAREGSVLLLNDGTGQFANRTAAVIAGIGRRQAGRSCAFGDLNHDGWPDLVRTGTRVFEVYFNRTEGDTVAFGDSGAPDFFIDGTDGINDPLTTNFEGLGLLDTDKDGLLDIAVQNEAGVRVFVNQGGEDLDLVSGIGFPEDAGNGDFLTVADLDDDADTDIIARLNNDGDLYTNDGNGQFTSASLNLPSDVDNKGATIVCDFDNDGAFDVFFTDGETGPRVNRVLRQEDGSFSPTTVPNIAGANAEGATCGDVDHDGDLDLIVNFVSSTQLFVNQLSETGELDFERDDRGLTGVTAGQGVTLGDIDADGDLDVFVAGSGPNALFRNGLDDDNFLIVRPWAEVGACPAGSVRREDLGAVVRLLDSGGTLLAMREISGGAGRGRMDQPIAHFGLPDGPAEAYLVRVRFQHGGAEVTVPIEPATLGPTHTLETATNDADGDSILDEVEQALADPDPDGDGIDAWLDVDADGDGISDAQEAGDADVCTPPVDSDNNGVPDFIDAPVGPDAGVDAGLPPDAGVPEPDGGAAVDAGNVDTGPPPGLDAGTQGVDLRGGGVAGCASGATPDHSLSPIFAACVLALTRRRRARRPYRTRR